MGCRGLPRPRVPRLVRLDLVHKESHQYVDVVRTLVECDLAQAQARDSNVATFEPACDQGSRPPRRRPPRTVCLESDRACLESNFAPRACGARPPRRESALGKGRP